RFGEFSILRRIDVRQAASEHRDRPSTAIQRPLLRCGIDAACHAADDRDPGLGQPECEPLRLSPSRSRGAAWPHNAHGQAVAWAAVTLDEQGRRGIATLL